MRKHGAVDKKNYRKTRLYYTYITFRAMLARCYQPTCKDYRRYGARGIKVCSRWRNSFDLFVKDMGLKPLGKSINRKNNDGNYKPGNCRWATPKQQAGNRRSNRWVSFRGRRMIVSDWAREIGIHKTTLLDRLDVHPVRVALLAPLDTSKRGLRVERTA